MNPILAFIAGLFAVKVGQVIIDALASRQLHSMTSVEALRALLDKSEANKPPTETGEEQSR